MLLKSNVIIVYLYRVLDAFICPFITMLFASLPLPILCVRILTHDSVTLYYLRVGYMLVAKIRHSTIYDLLKS